MYFKDDAAIYKIIGINIQYYRKKANLTQLQLAEGIGISLSYLSKIESNKCSKSMSLSVLNQIANYLNIDIVELFKEH